MTGGPSKNQIIELLESGMFRLQTQGLDKIEAILYEDPEAACELLPTLVKLWEEAPLLRRRISSNYEKIASEAPREFAKINDVLDHLISQIVDDPAGSGLTAVCILEPVAIHSPETLTGRISGNALSDVLDNGEPDERRAAYRLAGAVSNPASLELLTGVSDYEHDTLQEVAEAALVQAGQQLENQIKGTKYPLEQRTLDRIEVITRDRPEIFAQEAELFAQELQAKRSEVTADIISRIGESDQAAARIAVDYLVSTFEEDWSQEEARAIGQTTGLIASFHVDVRENLIEEFGQACDEDDIPLPSIWYAAIVPVSGVSPNQISRYVEEFCETSEDGEASVLARTSALHAVRNIIDAGEVRGVTVIKTLRKCASDTEEEIVIASVEALGAIPLKPVPPELSAATKSANRRIRQAAEEAIEHATARIHKHTLPDLPPEGSALNYLVEEEYLKYYRRDGIWVSPSVSGIQRSLFERVADAYNEGTGGSIILPWHDPSYIIPVALELGLQSVDSSGAVVIYSPFHRDHGTFGNLRAQYSNYGLNPSAHETTASTRFDEIIGTSRVNEQSGEIDSYTSGTASCQLVLAKNREDIGEVPDLVAVVANGINWAKEGVKTIDGFLEDQIDAPIYDVYSRVSRDDQEFGYSRYWIPESVGEKKTIAPDCSIDNDSEVDHREFASNEAVGRDPFENVSSQISREAEGAVVQIKQVGEGEVLAHLREAHGIVEELNEDRTEALYEALRGAVYWIQDMIAPLAIHDDWARTQTSLQGRFKPSTTNDLINMIDHEVESFSSLPFVEGTGFDLKQELMTLFELMQETNPKFDTLCDKIARVIEGDYTAAVVFLKVTRKEPAIQALCEDLDTTSSQLEAEGVYITDPNGIRDLQDLDITIFPNSLPRTMAGLYLLDNTSGSQILTYESGRDAGIRRDCEWYLDSVRSRCEGDIERCYPVARVEAVESDQEGPSAEEELSESTSDRSRLLDAVQSNLSGRAGSGGRGEASQIRVRTTDRDKLTYNSTSRVLVPVQAVGQEEYDWKRVTELGSGDRFLYIDPELRSRLLSRLLEESYEDDIGEEFDLYEILADWWEKTREIAAEADSIAEIHSRLRQAGLDRDYTTVRGWITSVKKAERPLDLVENSELVIGPERADDIRIIGEVYDIPEFRDQARVIESVMAACRGFNRTKGREVSRLIKGAVNRDEKGKVWDFIVGKEVAEIDRVSS